MFFASVAAKESLAASDLWVSESVSTGVWCVPGFGAGFEIALEPSKLQKEGEKTLEKDTFIFCAKLWYAANPGSKEI